MGAFAIQIVDAGVNLENLKAKEKVLCEAKDKSKPVGQFFGTARVPTTACSLRSGTLLKIVNALEATRGEIKELEKGFRSAGDIRSRFSFSVFKTVEREFKEDCDEVGCS